MRTHLESTETTNYNIHELKSDRNLKVTQKGTFWTLDNHLALMSLNIKLTRSKNKNLFLAKVYSVTETSNVKIILQGHTLLAVYFVFLFCTDLMYFFDLF